MKSYKQIYQKLPGEFIETICEQYEPNELDKVLAGYMSERPTTLRVNSLKTDVRNVMEAFRRDNVKFDRVLWYDDALVIWNKKEKDIERTSLYNDGQIYMQSLSSMVPPLVLSPEPGWKVLDLTAAPGGKSTQMAALMGNKGFILANEINGIRAERMKYNIEKQGAEIIEVRVGDGKKMEESWEGFFDAVLLDTPCSGAGTFLVSNSQTYRGWSKKLLSKLVKEQRKLMETAVRALKIGGVFVYSTCSILREENEENIGWMMDTYKGSIIPDNISLKLEGAGVDCRIRGSGSKMGNMMIIYPTELYEGFFVSRFRKAKS